ncbi:MAG: hypothetical protein AAGF11_51480 [Myxococcota bacterium]
MIPPRWLVVALTLVVGPVLGISCYSEQQPPPTYRYPCDADADCTGAEICRRGLCERPCTQTEVFAAVLVSAEEQPCPIEDGYVGCYNGACASICELGSDYCPNGHACLDVGFEASSGGFGGTTEVGACMFECSGDDSDLCLATEVCTDGVCTPIDCEAGETCPDGYLCLFGSCSALCSGGQACPDGTACDPMFGICTPECSPACADDSTCYFGACATNCTEDDDCPDDLVCLAGVCLLEGLLPDGLGTTGGSTTGDDMTDAGMTDTGMTDTGPTDMTDDGSSTGDTGTTGDTDTTGTVIEPTHAEGAR